MIRIEFNEPTTKTWQRWRADCRTATARAEETVRRGEELEISDLYRRKSVKKDVYVSKTGPFSGKCAYCECYLTDFQHGDMEHFRPKKGVTDEDDRPVLVANPGGGSTPHPGYYWLAYEWTNLLPSCVACNQAGEFDGQKIGKHNRFPVIGNHAITFADVPHEQPCLINPAQEDPAPHLKVDTKTGLLAHETRRGEMCIKIFGLNLRDRLPEARQKAMNDVKAKLVEIVHNPDAEAKQRAVNELKAIQAGTREYSLAARAVLAEVTPWLRPLFET